MKGNLKCPHFEGELDPKLLEVVHNLENYIIEGKKYSELFGELVVTSGGRCPECNKKVGGKPTSAHLKGKALDIAVTGGSREWFWTIKILLQLGVRRIGIAPKRNFLHFDVDEEKPQDVIWFYT